MKILISKSKFFLWLTLGVFLIMAVLAALSKPFQLVFGLVYIVFCVFVLIRKPTESPATEKGQFAEWYGRFRILAWCCLFIICWVPKSDTLYQIVVGVTVTVVLGLFAVAHVAFRFNLYKPKPSRPKSVQRVQRLFLAFQIYLLILGSIGAYHVIYLHQ